MPLDLVDMAGAVAFARRVLLERGRARILAVNPEKVVALGRDPWLLEFFRSADLLIPDGIGVVWAARFLGGADVARVTGADLLEELCALAALGGHPIFLYGGEEAVNEAAASRLSERFPGLVVAGRAHGFQPRAAAGELVRAINDSGAEILFVGLGSPRQERWIAEHEAALRVRVIQGVGGTPDVLAGKVKRAPLGWQQAHLEWLFRLLHDPRRLRRQSALPLFAARVLWARLAPHGGH